MSRLIFPRGRQEPKRRGKLKKSMAVCVYLGGFYFEMLKPIFGILTQPPPKVAVDISHVFRRLMTDERQTSPLLPSLAVRPSVRPTERRLTRISLCIVWLFMFCHVWKLVPTIYELVHAGDDASLRRWPGTDDTCVHIGHATLHCMHEVPGSGTKWTFFGLSWKVKIRQNWQCSWTS